MHFITFGTNFRLAYVRRFRFMHVGTLKYAFEICTELERISHAVVVTIKEAVFKNFQWLLT